MLDLRWILENEDLARKKLALRSFPAEIIDRIKSADTDRRALLKEVEELRSRRNALAKDIGTKKRNGESVDDLMAESNQVNARIEAIDGSVTETVKKVEDLLLNIPNMVDDSVPSGAGSEDNKEVRRWGDPKKFSFQPLDHHDLGLKLGILDFERAGRMTGARFSVLLGKGARLERALINFMLDLHAQKHGYVEMIPPFMCNSAAMLGTGQLPKFREDLFKLDGFDWYLIPTAEVPVTNYYREEVLEEGDLPKKFTAYTPCFRSEAGSAGRDTKGLIRQHQFDKVELVVVCHPDKSAELHEALTDQAEEVLRQLGLPYRTMLLCGGDIGFGSRKTYDLEVWLPGQNAYREISSCSNFGDFQARRMSLRFRTGKDKPRFAHTLNGSGLAVGRTLVAILENFQEADGSVRIPEVLQKYTGFDRIDPVH